MNISVYNSQQQRMISYQHTIQNTIPMYSTGASAKNTYITSHNSAFSTNPHC